MIETELVSAVYAASVQGIHVDDLAFPRPESAIAGSGGPVRADVRAERACALPGGRVRAGLRAVLHARLRAVLHARTDALLRGCVLARILACFLARIRACIRVCILASVSLVLAACAPDTCNLDRVGVPVRFADVRETAAWTPDFDPSWWGPIDRAYSDYDAEVERVTRRTWEPCIQALRESEQTGFPTEPRAARAMWATHLRVRRELGDAENALATALSESLPPAAAPFIELLRARAAFWRASAVWTGPAQRMPGPLEVLALTGPPVADAALVRAATDAYARLAAVAARAAEERFEAYIEFCEEIGPAEAERLALEKAMPPERAQGDPPERIREREEAEARLGEALARVDRIRSRLDRVARREADEKCRLAILREGRAFAVAIADPERQLDVLDRFDAFLHAGVRSHQSLRALRDVSLRAAGRKFADAEARNAAETRIKRAFEAYFEAEKPLRARLAGSSAADREHAYRKLTELIGPLYAEIAGATGVQGDALDLASIGVSAGRGSADDAALAAIGPASEERPPEPEAVDDGLVSARSRELAILSGTALSPRVIATLVGELALGVVHAQEIGRLRAEEVAGLSEQSRGIVGSLRAEFDRIGADAAQDGRARARGIMRETRAATGRLRASDAAANARVVAAISARSGVGLDDPRFARAGLELELLSIIGASGRSSAAEGVGGVVADAVLSPFEIIRTMDAGPEERDAALAIAFGFADELRASHAEAAERMFRNTELLVARLLDAQAAGGRPEDAWRPVAGGTRGIAVRRAIAAEIARVLGVEVERAYHERWRELAQPGMTPPRAPAIARLARFAEGVGMDGAERAATAALRQEIDAVLLASADARESALRALHAWRVGIVSLGDVDDASDWAGVARYSGEGAFLRGRVHDVDDRAIARCEMLLALDASARGSILAAETRDALREGRLELPARLTPYFPKD